jgi:hypothetical protein
VEDVIVDDEVIAEERGLNRSKRQIAESTKRSSRLALYFMFLNRPPTVLATISSIATVGSQGYTIT